MNEYRSSIEFASPDLPLRDDVRRLGALVGDLLVEQVSAAFLDDVEDVRTRAIARRENQAPLSELADGLAGRTPQQAETMVRAFSTYFQVVNIAERVHRIRRRRDYQRAGTAGAQPDGLQDALQHLKAQGVGRTSWRSGCHASTLNRCSPHTRPKRYAARCWKKSS